VKAEGYHANGHNGMAAGKDGGSALAHGHPYDAKDQQLIENLRVCLHGGDFAVESELDRHAGGQRHQYQQRNFDHDGQFVNDDHPCIACGGQQQAEHEGNREYGQRVGDDGHQQRVGGIAPRPSSHDHAAAQG